MIRLIGALASAMVMVASIVYLAWWQLGHNFINTSCPNYLYRYAHLAQCATWDRSCGIVAAVTIPLIVAGFFGAVGLTAWYVVDELD